MVWHGMVQFGNTTVRRRGLVSGRQTPDRHGTQFVVGMIRDTVWYEKLWCVDGVVPDGLMHRVTSSPGQIPDRKGMVWQGMLPRRGLAWAVNADHHIPWYDMIWHGMGGC